MKKYLRLFTALVTLLTLAVSSYATHLAGGNITYSYLGNNSYHIQLILYRDCSPGTATLGTTQILYAASSCWSPTLQVVLQLAAGSGPGNQVSGTPCASFTTCYEEYLYEGILTLPINCHDWNFYWSTCCRNNIISNLSNPGGEDLWINATLNSIDAPNNSSPTFNFDPIQAFCVNQEYYFDWGIIEPDGDSLVFSFTAPLDGPTVPVIFSGSFNAICPFPTSPPCSMTIDPHTGVINFTPSQTGSFVFAILIQEFNPSGVLIGSVVRDIQINVVANCTVLIPVTHPSIAYDPNDPSIGINLTCGDMNFIYSIDPNVVEVQCGSVALDGSDFRIIGPYNNPNLVPIVSATPINCASGLIVDILITLFEPLKNGTYTLGLKIGNDGNTLSGECGFVMPEDTALARIIVTDPSKLEMATAEINCHDVSVSLAYPEGFDCSTLTSNSSDFTLVDQFGNPQTINSITSADCNLSQEYGYQLDISFAFGATIPDTLYLLAQTGSDNNTIANRCGNFSAVGDTLALISVGGNIPVDLGPDMNLCDYDAIPLLDAGVVAMNYVWTLNSDPTPISTDPSYQPTGSGMYTVVVTDGPTCTGADVIQISITPSPQIDLGSDITYCTGDPIQDLDATSPGINPSYQWTFNGAPLSTQPVISPGQTGLYVVEVNIGAQCLGYDSIYVDFVQQLSVLINGIDTLCNGETTDLTISTIGPNPDTYQWSLNGNPVGGNNAVLNVADAGIYSVIVTSASGCTGTQTFEVTTATYPPAPVTNCASVVSGLYTYQWAPVPEAVSYQVSIDGGVTWITPSSGETGTQHQTNVPTNNFVVQVFNGTKCSPGPASARVACEILIPNVITPSDDGKNDVFVIKNLIQYPDNNLKIFNRWGTLIYDKNSYGMDGYWWNGGSSLSGGVYFYVINLNDGNEPRRGTLTVIK
jgi:gliding motility-associated-like protein